MATNVTELLVENENATANGSMDPMEDNWSPSKHEILKIYGDHMHIYVGLTLCLCGSIFNIFNIIVFTRKHMISPINTLLAFLATADLLVLIFYTPRLWYTYEDPNIISSDFENSFVGEILLVGHVYVIVWFINVSTWLTVTASAFRLASIAYPAQSSGWCSMKNVRKIVIVIFVLCLAFQLADFVFAIIAASEYYENDIFEEWIGTNGTSALSEHAVRVYAVVTGVVFRILPSILISVFSLRLALVLWKTRRQYLELNAQTNTTTNDSNGEKHMARVTLILVILSIISLVTLIPRGVGHLFYIFDGKLYLKFYTNLVEVFELLVLINATFPFVVYCSINQIFRVTFKALFCNKVNNLSSNGLQTDKSVPFLFNERRLSQTEFSLCEVNK